MSQIIIGYTTEGSTDVKFLASIIQRTFEAVGFECTKDIEVVEPIIYIDKKKGDHFTEQIVDCCQRAFDTGVMAFCVHVDADEHTDEAVFRTRMNPTFEEIDGMKEEICNNLVADVPVWMTESWMLADKPLLKEEIGTDMTDGELGIAKDPEAISDPKEAISEAIRIARQPLGKRRRRDLTISDLYQSLGQKISTDSLERLPSYLKFKEGVRDAYRKLNYLR